MKGTRAVAVSLGSFILAALLFSPVRAENASEDISQPPDFGLTPREHDVAVVIGIEKYRDIGAPSTYSAGDATLVKAYLKSLGFRETNIRLMINDRATRTDFIKNIEKWLPDNVKPDGKVFFYYSGHGSPDLSDAAHPRAYLLPYDGDPNDLGNTGYSIERLYDHLDKLKAQEVIVVLDSCFSGQGGRSVLAQGARPMVNNIVPVGVIGGNMAVLTATQPNQISTSSPDKQHGIMTYYFLKAIHDGTSNIVSIYKKIKPAVEDDAHALGVTQSPSLMLGKSDGQQPFALAADLDIAMARQKKIELEKAEQAKKDAEQKRLAEEQRLADEQKRLEDEKKRLADAQAESDRKHQEELARIEAENAEKAAEQQRRFDEEKRRLERERKSAPSEEPAFVPPTF
ncbi:MAG: caspase family protein [Elusimicrobia bacterium]|nr:caspase family protein [Elusimicrobiota bacterium]